MGTEAKSANFSTRISQETRGQLDALAAERPTSVSQVAQEMLELGLQTKKLEGKKDDPIRALAHLLRLLARDCRYVDEGEYREWHNDPFAFDAFTRSIQMLLERVRPTGEIKAPREISPGFPTWPTSEKQAEVAAANVWREIVSTAPMDLSELRERVNRPSWANEIAEERGITLSMSKNLIGRISTYSYALDDVRRSLGIKLEGKKP